MEKQRPFLNVLFLCRFALLLVSVIFTVSSCSNQPQAPKNARTVSFDDGWRFIKDTLSGAERSDFNDSDWRMLDIPHDWSIEDLAGQNGVDIIGPEYVWSLSVRRQPREKLV